MIFKDEEEATKKLTFINYYKIKEASLPFFISLEKIKNFAFVKKGEKMLLLILSALLTLFIALEHIYIFVLEMFFNESETAQKVFGLDSEFLKDERVKNLFSNQGLYNAFLAVGLLWSLTETGIFRYQLSFFFLTCVLCAAIYGSITSNKKIFYIQGIPALLALISTGMYIIL